MLFLFFAQPVFSISKSDGKLYTAPAIIYNKKSDLRKHSKDGE